VNNNGWSLKGLPGVTLLSFTADPTKFRELRPLFETADREYATAIILGTVAAGLTEVDAPAVTQDSRVLSTLLILRELSSQSEQPIHCIAETRQHQTPSLALSPGMGRGLQPDFIDTQEIIARSLAMNVSYPQIQDALTELIDTNSFTPEIDFINPRHIGLRRNTRATFGAVQVLIYKRFKARGVAIGYQQGNKLFFAPTQHHVVRWSKQHRIVIICRILEDGSNAFHRPPSPDISLKSISEDGRSGEPTPPGQRTDVRAQSLEETDVNGQSSSI